MNIATLKVKGTDEVLESLQRKLNLVPQKTWKKGDSTTRGNLYSTSGFSFTIADVATPRELVEVIRAHLINYKQHDLCFAKPDLSTELSVGITVGESTQFAACLEFNSADLELLTELGINLAIWAYPASDE